MKSILTALSTVLIMATAPQPAQAQTMLYDQEVQTIDGETVTLEKYKGKALLIVNTASRCGFTSQYATMQKLYEQYKDQGFEVLAFPSNDFMNQEPGSNQEIKEFCSLKFRTSFPLFEKIHVKGKQMHPLYAQLTQTPGFEGDVSWNFNKFLISPEGQVVARFGSRIDPMDAKVVQELESILSN